LVVSSGHQVVVRVTVIHVVVPWQPELPQVVKVEVIVSVIVEVIVV
jgi:hypothetical protein